MNQKTVPLVCIDNDGERVVVGNAQVSVDEIGIKVTGKVLDPNFAGELAPHFWGDYSIGTDFSEPNEIAEQALAQAHRYGEQLRDLINNEMFKDIPNVENAWREFRRGLLSMDLNLYSGALNEFMKACHKKR